MSLCYRCEHRAKNKEDKSQPRHECGTDRSVCSCYMYQPVKPLIVAPLKGEKRPLLAGVLFAGRMVSKGVAEGEYQAIKQGRNLVVYFMPKPLTKKEVTKKIPKL